MTTPEHPPVREMVQQLVDAAPGVDQAAVDALMDVIQRVHYMGRLAGLRELNTLMLADEREGIVAPPRIVAHMRQVKTERMTPPDWLR